MMLWLLSLGCTSGPDPDRLAGQLLSADIAQAVASLSAAELAEDSPLAPWQAVAVEITALSAERDAIHAAERGMLLEAARAALAGDHPAAAAASLRAGLASAPGDSDFLDLLVAFEASAASAPPADAAEMFAALAELQPARADAHRAAAEAASVAERYAASTQAQTRAAQAGAHLEAAVHLLGQIDREYYVPPDWAAATAAGQRRLAALQADGGAQAALPGLSVLSWPVVEADGLAGAVGALTADVSAAGAVGVPEEVVVVEWVDAALGSLDAWTRAVWPAEISAWQAHHDGVSYGVGVDLIETDGGNVFVNRPRLGAPSWESALRQGDRLDRITDAGQDVALSDLPAGQRLAAAEAALMGPAGSAVTLSLTRPEVGLQVVELVRGPVKMETLHGLWRGDDNAWRLWLDADAQLAYVRVLSFRDYTEEDFDAILAGASGASGLLVDLRSNPGGDLNAAVQMSDRFVAGGLLAELAGRAPKDDSPPVDPETGEPLIPWNHAIAGHAQEGLAVVVLVDRDTASAAEILAGVLQERAGAIVVGAPTWGKGYTQVLRPELERGYAVQFTNQIWTLPSGRHLAQGGGIQPDVPLVLSPGEQFQADLLAKQRAALRTHKDGTPLEWLDTVRRSDLPPLSADPAMLHGELVLRALVYRNSTAAPD